MDRLEAHRDGSLLSFTVTLTPPSRFQAVVLFLMLRDVSSPDFLFYSQVARSGLYVPMLYLTRKQMLHEQRR
jgi:hypothetical protein